jgi:hypothetical protein
MKRTLLSNVRPDPAAMSRQGRSVGTEILDGLDPASSAAQASRRDLIRINGLMGNHDWFKRSLRQNLRPDEAVLEIGAGTGELGRAGRAVAPGIAGLDLIPRPPAWPAGNRWFETDVLAFTGWADFPVVIANLFFHHFDDAQLARLGVLMNRARVIVACEPLRLNRTARLFSLLCPCIGAHPVTRHDGRLSIAAGFRHDELPRLLGLDPTVWSWRVSATWRGASRMVAVKRS